MQILRDQASFARSVTVEKGRGQLHLTNLPGASDVSVGREALGKRIRQLIASWALSCPGQERLASRQAAEPSFCRDQAVRATAKKMKSSQ